MGRYKTRDAADLLGLSTAQVRSFARAGLLAPQRGPRGEYSFSFQDIVLLRAAKELAEARIHPRKIRRTLLSLQAQLPSGRPLAAVRIAAEGDRIVVRDAGKTWSPESGQLQFDFAVSEVATRRAPLVRRVVKEAEAQRHQLSGEDWYSLGLELEPVEPEEAKKAYRRAIGLDPGNADAHANLGRLLQEEGELADAAEQYLEALTASPDNAIAAFNLGTALEDRGRIDEAISAYTQAIEADPDFTDAHFNLARLYERVGKLNAALRHLRSFKVLTK